MQESLKYYCKTYLVKACKIAAQLHEGSTWQLHRTLFPYQAANCFLCLKVNKIKVSLIIHAADLNAVRSRNYFVYVLHGEGQDWWNDSWQWPSCPSRSSSSSLAAPHQRRHATPTANRRTLDDSMNPVTQQTRQRGQRCVFAASNSVVFVWETTGLCVAQNNPTQPSVQIPQNTVVVEEKYYATYAGAVFVPLLEHVICV